MAYQAPIQRSNPTAFIFLVDQSGSMSDKMTTEKSKAQFVADVINRTLMNLIGRCNKSEGVRDYFEIAVLCYSENGTYNGFQGELSGQVLHKISSIEAAPLRVENRKRKVDDGAGGIIEQNFKFPVWIDPTSNGATPMCSAITTAMEILAVWCDSHPDSYPPTLLHVTDGDSTDGDPTALAETLKQFHTNDGGVLMFNLHVSGSGMNPVLFPASESNLPDSFAHRLFQMSSPLPKHLVGAALEKGILASVESRGFMFNADAAEIVDFFDIGTRPTQLR